MLEYHAVYYQDEGGWIMAEVLDYPGVLSQGRTLKSAKRMIRHALRTMAQLDIEQGRPLPRPNGCGSELRDERDSGSRPPLLHAETIPLRFKVEVPTTERLAT